ncbi:hypothetical protein BGZ94_003031 [Podila epigama]|nr:hypothetical protein BGZ94_003031 [Podila epigama]
MTTHINARELNDQKGFVFKHCVIYDSTGKLRLVNPIVSENSPDRLWNGGDLTIILSSQELPQQKKTATFLENIFGDIEYSDITFVFPGTSLDTQQTTIPSGEPELEKSSPVTNNKEKVKTLMAHKAVLAQWPYFKTMFERDFAEGGPGHQQVTVKDTSVATFKVLLRYIYTETIPVALMPDHIYDDPLNNNNFSWEHIFLAADWYDIEGLREEAADRLIVFLDEKHAKDFLFRTAYMFEDLRGTVMGYILKNCGETFFPTDTPDLYKDHPEYTKVIGEMYATLYKLHQKSLKK